MIDPASLKNRAVMRPGFTDRQETAVAWVERYYEVAMELPSTGWLARRMSISRKRAWEHMAAIREKLERSARRHP
jgi:DNA-binding CsgD family transcriptional regulator